MEALTSLCDNAGEYPKNLISNKVKEHVAASYFTRLNTEESRLFHTQPDETVLDIWEFGDQGRAFWPKSVTNTVQLRETLRAPSVAKGKDPRCRFIFVHAHHSRDKLRVSRHMLMSCFSYHGVMPSFLDLLFCFGEQDYAQDFHFSGFRHRSCIYDTQRILKIPELGWSGREIHLCYSLRSVETTKSEHTPWSVRQCAVYHSFDIGTGRAVWIVVKGDKSMQDRIKAVTGSQGPPEMKSFGLIDQSFQSSLEAHGIFSEWSAENWRWYISYLESTFQKATRHILSRPVIRPRNAMPNAGPYSPVPPSPSQFEGMVPSLQRRLTQISQSASPKAEALNPQRILSRFREKQQEQPQQELAAQDHPEQEHPEQEYPDQEHPEIAQTATTQGPPEFSFADLQTVQSIEERANEGLLVLKSNASVLAGLRNYYQSLTKIRGWPDSLRTGCEEQLATFDEGIYSIERDIQMHQTRIEALLSLMTERKALLLGVLDFQNMEANRALASEAQFSTKNVEAMTWSMHDIAEKTKQETVSMRIITLVTLAFLPGTFISVGGLTLMSTEIFHFDSSGPGAFENFLRPNALWFFLAVSLPLVLITLGAWGLFYLYSTRKKSTGPPAPPTEFKEYSDAV